VLKTKKESPEAKEGRLKRRSEALWESKKPKSRTTWHKFVYGGQKRP